MNPGTRGSGRTSAIGSWRRRPITTRRGSSSSRARRGSGSRCGLRAHRSFCNCFCSRKKGSLRDTRTGGGTEMMGEGVEGKESWSSHGVEHGDSCPDRSRAAVRRVRGRIVVGVAVADGVAAQGTRGRRRTGRRRGRRRRSRRRGCGGRQDRNTMELGWGPNLAICFLANKRVILSSSNTT